MAPTTTADIVAKLVAVMQPKLGDVIQDPAAGTGGFLIAAQHWIREHEDVSLLDEERQSREGQTLPPASLILTNPPFCTKKGGLEERELPVGWVEARVGELVQQLLQP